MKPTLFSAETAPQDARRALAQQLPIAALGPVIEVYFPTATTARDIPHGLDRVPDGYVVVLESGGFVKAITVDRWSDQIAWMNATADHTRARLCFYTLREGAITNVIR